MSTTPSRARRAAALLAVATLLGGALYGLGPGSAGASSHREAPLIAADPAVDNTDLYAFVSPDRPDYVTFVANWMPFEEPNGGPNFYPFATDATYNINVDNDGDAQARRHLPVDVQDRRQARQQHVPLQQRPGHLARRREPAGPPDATRWSPRSTATPFKTRVTNAPVAPSRVGAASMPDYGKLRDQAPSRCPAAGRSSPARPTTRSSWTCASSTCSTAAT